VGQTEAELAARGSGDKNQFGKLQEPRTDIVETVTNLPVLQMPVGLTLHIESSTALVESGSISSGKTIL
jgi:hypothetical protein